MKKKNRVCKNHEFSSIIARRTCIKTPAFVFYYVSRKEDSARIGISVGKKLGGAVQRNRIKRQVRAMADTVFDYDEPFDGVIIVRPEFLKNSYATNLALLEQTAKRIEKKFGKEPQ